MDNAQRIKESLDLKTVMEDSGIQFNNKGFCKCFIHNEKTGSMSIKNQHYTCFGCGARGDVIDFIMGYCGLDFKGALKKLDDDYSLHVLKTKLSREERADIKVNNAIDKRKKAWEDAILDNYRRIVNVRRILFQQSLLREPKDLLGELVDKLDVVLDDFTGKEARRWMN